MVKAASGRRFPIPPKGGKFQRSQQYIVVDARATTTYRRKRESLPGILPTSTDLGKFFVSYDYETAYRKTSVIMRHFVERQRQRHGPGGKSVRRRLGDIAAKSLPDAGESLTFGLWRS
jgi:hypothetical protein